MQTRPRHPFPFLVAAFALAACSSEVAPAGCRSDAQCPAASRCQASLCVADRTPVAAIRHLAGAVEEFALVEIDGSGSGDPDGDDAVAEHVWTIRSLTARCEPPEVAGRQPVARVRFGCPGWYEVSLAVRDALGVESAPASSTLEVVPSAGASVVTAGPDLSTDHVCAGEPLLCRPVDPISLSATTAVPGLALQWAVEPPPDRPLHDGTRRVLLASGTAAAPSAWIETDGAGISGDWVFRVEARDSYGVAGAAYTRVSIRNRPPALVTAEPAPFPHAFHADAARFTSLGAVEWSVQDPDGDPLDVEATWRHIGDGAARFDGELAPGKATFAVEVPYATPADALLLRGGAGLARTIELVARDPNGGLDHATVAIEIGNRPPQPAGGNVDRGVRHTFDPIRSRYVADVQLGAWTDPDGDPVFASAGTAPCETVYVVDGIARAECSVPFEGTPALDRLVGQRSLTVPVHDPWEFTPSIPVHAVEFLNSPPTLALASPPGSVCFRPFNQFLIWPVDAAEFWAIPSVSDPDGDPILLDAFPVSGGSVSPNQTVCTTPRCPPFLFFQPEMTVRALEEGFPQLPPSRLRASDGGGAVEIEFSPVPIRC